MKQKPVHEIRIGSIKATIWANDANGKVIHNVTFSRSYRAGEDWKKTSSFSRSHLDKLAEAIAEADRWIAEAEPKESEIPAA